MHIANLSHRLALTALALAAATPALAVQLNPAGTGQVLLYAYYTGNAGQQTIVSVTNPTDQGKALRVRLAEGRNGRDVLVFNVYLAAHDSWSGTVFALSDTGPAALTTSDTSCTYPDIRTSATLPALPNGARYVPLRNLAYTGAADDAGPDGLERTREGSIEIFEMGAIQKTSAFAAAISPQNDGVPGNCGYLATTWASTWATNPSANLENPSGGLFGNATVQRGDGSSAFDYAAVALDGFRMDPLDKFGQRRRSVVLHTLPTNAQPSLNDAISSPLTNLVSADVIVKGEAQRLEYPPGRGVDAVTAVLSAAPRTTNTAWNRASARAPSGW